MDIRAIIGEAWPDWEALELIGEGAYGTVYRARRLDGQGADAAIKVTAIPQDASETDALAMEGLSREQSESYLEGVVMDLASEIKLMQSLRGCENIVRIEDSRIIRSPERLLWHILIRMELLTSLSRRLTEGPMAEGEVIRLGMDLCRALDVCHHKHIIHRDIKPENIFIGGDDRFKLGDFGVARRLEQVTTGITRRGTYNYMAPEVFNQTLVDADITAMPTVPMIHFFFLSEAVI